MLFYNLGVHCYTLAIYLASFFKTKAKLWVQGRKNWEQNYSEKLKTISGKKIWIHCASLGEFEQGRPLIEKIKQDHPAYRIILTFFSPSGYEISKNYEKADAVFYLPADSKSNTVKFLEIVKPEKVIFIKYEFWVNYLNTLREKNIESYLVSAVFKPHHPFFKWYGGIFIRSLKAFKILFVQDERSEELLKTIGVNNVQICGDTRFDRVLEIKNKFRPIPEIERFKGTDQLIVAGSTWPGDEDLLLESFTKLDLPSTKLMIVPHDIEDSLLKATVAKLKKHELSYCLYTEGIKPETKVLILNTMGLLSKAYHYANVAYIGGGFNGGIHNCLEAAVYGVPVIFYGKDFHKYNEAVELMGLKAASNVNSPEELNTAITSSLQETNASQTASRLKSYFESKGNVTGKILSQIRF